MSLDFTTVMTRVRAGDEAARDEALRLVYSELHGVAKRRLYLRPGHSIEASDLVNEAYARLVGRNALDWQNRKHFFALAARAMNDILVERARAKGAVKRGGDWHRVSMVSAVVAVDQDPSGFLALDEAIQSLRSSHASCWEVVQLTYYGGLTIRECAIALEVSPSTVDRLLKFSRAWLLAELERGGETDESKRASP